MSDGAIPPVLLDSSAQQWLATITRSEVFIASKWALCRQLDTPAAVERFLRQVGGPDA